MWYEQSSVLGDHCPVGLCDLPHLHVCCGTTLCRVSGEGREGGWEGRREGVCEGMSEWVSKCVSECVRRQVTEKSTNE